MCQFYILAYINGGMMLYDFVNNMFLLETMSGPLKPGLVYDTKIIDHLKTILNNFSCPANSSDELVSNMNYPSIAVSLSKVRETKKVTKIVTKIYDEESVYMGIITTLDALRV